MSAQLLNEARQVYVSTSEAAQKTLSGSCFLHDGTSPRLKIYIVWGKEDQQFWLF